MFKSLASYFQFKRNKKHEQQVSDEIKKADSISDSASSKFLHKHPTTLQAQAQQYGYKGVDCDVDQRDKGNQRYISKARTVTPEYKSLYLQNCPPLLPQFSPDRDIYPPLSLTRPWRSGKYGSVYIYKLPDNQAAIKHFHHEYQNQQQDLELEKQFMREISKLCGFKNKHLVQYQKVSVIPGHRAILMEYVDHSLRTFIHDVARPNRIQLKTVLRLTRSIAKALQYLHSKGVVHRDLRPSNILISKGGYCKVSSYGLYACVKGFRVGKVSHARDLAYTAPEIFNGGEISYGSDIWGLGIILFEMVSGTKPWEGKSPGSIAMAICSNDLLQIPVDTPNQVKQLIQSCWNVSPSKRPTAKNVVDTCQKILQQIQVSS